MALGLAQETALGLIMKAKLCSGSRRACQLTYDLLKCNHPDVRSGLLFLPTGTWGICFDISKICINGGVRGRVMKCANAFSLKL